MRFDFSTEMAKSFRTEFTFLSHSSNIVSCVDNEIGSSCIIMAVKMASFVWAAKSMLVFGIFPMKHKSMHSSITGNCDSICFILLLMGTITLAPERPTKEVALLGLSENVIDAYEDRPGRNFPSDNKGVGEGINITL